MPLTLDLLAKGNPVSVEEISAASGKSPEEVRLAIDQVAGVDLDEQGRIVSAGLSLLPTPQAVTIALSPEDAFALSRNWALGGPRVSKGMACGC